MPSIRVSTCSDTRCQMAPSCAMEGFISRHACMHVAQVPVLPDSFLLKSVTFHTLL